MSNYLGENFFLKVFSESDVATIYEEALGILERTGCRFEAENARQLLLAHGAVAKSADQICFPRHMVEAALKSVPNGYTLYNLKGEEAARIDDGNRSYFDTGGVAVNWVNPDGSLRRSLAQDQITTAKLQQGLKYIDFQGITNVHMDDVPEEVSDPYGAYLCARHCEKPLVLPYMYHDSLKYTYRLISALVGGEKNLAEKPIGHVVVTPTSPLIWCELASQGVMEAAKYKLPVEFISAPLPGAGAPATLAGTVLLATVENLAGLVLSQISWPGQPVIFGCAPMYFDMASMNPLPTSVESSLIIMGIAQMGKFLSLPVQAYSGMADSKSLDLQAGWEDATSAMLPMLAGVNILSGAGQSEFLLAAGPEKLVAMNDLIGMLQRVKRGISVSEETLATKLIEELGPAGDYLGTRHTLKWFRKEPFFPSKIIDRKTRRPDSDGKEPTILERAIMEKERILNAQPERIEYANNQDFDRIMAEILKELDCTGKVPLPPQ